MSGSGSNPARRHGSLRRLGTVSTLAALGLAVVYAVTLAGPLVERYGEAGDEINRFVIFGLLGLAASLVTVRVIAGWRGTIEDEPAPPRRAGPRARRRIGGTVPESRDSIGTDPQTESQTGEDDR